MKIINVYVENQKEKSEIVFNLVVIEHLSSIEQVYIRLLVEARIKRIWNPKGNNRKAEAKKKNTEKLERKNYTKSLTKGQIKQKVRADKKINRKAEKNKNEKNQKEKKTR